MKIEYMAQVYNNELHVAGLIEEYLRWNPVLAPITVEEGTETQPFPVYINLVERNIDELMSRVTWVTPQEPTRDWKGEHEDSPTFRYSDVNRWFRDLLYLRWLLDSIPPMYRKLGTFQLGNDFLVQYIIR
jgi:hypothetical protein